MSGRRTWLPVCLFFLLTLPLAAHERQVLLVLVDPVANRAYIPEGSVVPAGVSIRMETFRPDAETIAQLRGDRDGGRGNVRELRGNRAATERLKAKPALVFAYAPADRFVAARKSYEAQTAKRQPRMQADSSHQSCYDIYVYQEAQGEYHTYGNGFTSTSCVPSGSITVGNSYTWEFRSTGDYSDDDPSIDPYVFVDDANGNYSCFDWFSWPGDGSCSASAHTQWLQQGCLNYVDTGSLQYVIEYLPGYVENYLGFNFLVDYCTYYY